MSTQGAGASEAVPYRGEDRRRLAGPVRSPFGRPYLLAVTLIVVVATTASLAIDVSGNWTDQTARLIGLLQMASLMVAIAVGALAISRWYLTSDAPALWIGVALGVYAIARLAAAELVPLVVGGDALLHWTSWLRPASQIVVVALLARAALTVPVISSISGPRLTLAAVTALVVLAAALRLASPLATIVDGAAQGYPRTYATVNQVGVMPFAFSALGALFTWRAYRRRRWLFAWLGLMLFSLALGDVARVLAAPPVESGLLGKEILRLLGLLLALHGATVEILYTYRDSSTRLARSEYTAMTAQERIRAEQALAEERAHEARSALAAIEGATKTLEHYRDRLPPETQAALSTAVSGEIRRLQRLVSVEQPEGEIAPFSLAETLSPVVASERARGVMVDVQVPGSLDVVGRTGSTEQVLQTLFDNARRYAPGSPVTVRAARDGQWVVLRVEDRGPGVPPAERELIFRRGVRGDTAASVTGSGLGLYVAAKLMHEQAGRLWVDEREGGGASFALALPADTDSSRSSTPETPDRGSGLWPRGKVGAADPPR